MTVPYLSTHDQFQAIYHFPSPNYQSNTNLTTLINEAKKLKPEKITNCKEK